MSYSAVRLAAAAQGMLFALAHVRGGGDLGRHWHKAGRHAAKPRSVADYLACARHLIDQRWTSAGRIIAAGESAGGLVLGMALNRAPELFLMGHGRVPFVDALHTMLDVTLPLTPGEWPEWGNPAANAADFDLIREGSPYEAVTAQAYPPVIATAGISDQRVGYWEPAKWIARLRAQSTSAAAMLLRVDWSSGHGSGEAASERREEQATAFAFALHLASSAGDVRSASAT
jgi:oligopeptidase B